MMWLRWDEITGYDTRRSVVNTEECLVVSHLGTTESST